MPDQPLSIRPTHWAFFNLAGKKLMTAEDIFAAEAVIVYEGGSFIYPAVSLGFIQHVMVGSMNVSLTSLNVMPPVFQVNLNYFNSRREKIKIDSSFFSGG